MTYPEVLANARKCLDPNCKACTVCNGRACGNHIPGPGAKGVGDTAIRNYEKWQNIRVNMDTICPYGTPDTSLELFGKKFRYPFFAGPVGAVTMHYSDKYDDMAYNDILVRACADNGIAAFTGDGMNSEVMKVACKAIGAAGGNGIPTVKPWNLDTVQEKMDCCKASGCFAIAMDIDAAGLPFLKNFVPPAGSKTVEELAQIVKMAGVPFIVKGVMTVAGALKAKEAGAAGIVVSNHGGRVLVACKAIGAAGGNGIPTVKPWNLDTVQEKMDCCKASGCFAIAMDIDAAGLPFLKNFVPPAGSKTVEELAQIVKMAGVPFIVKGVMTVAGALKAKEAGAAGIVVSNHGGRVLDQCSATAEVLADIVDALKGSGVKVLVDGGIRSGVDVFKALAIGADAVLICRPFVPAVYGGAEEGVKLYIDKIGAELADTMAMCGAKTLGDITRDMVRLG